MSFGGMLAFLSGKNISSEPSVLYSIIPYEIETFFPVF
jgi:hypothetical protein